MADVPNLQAAASALTSRLPKHTFTIPADKFVDGKDGAKILVYKGPRELDSDPKEVTMRQLTFEEEQAALTASRVKNVDFSYEGAMRAVVAADGKPITWENDGKEAFFRGLSAQVRDLVVQGFQSISIPKRAAAEDFLASEKIETTS
jgi:hypothetical protein